MEPDYYPRRDHNRTQIYDNRAAAVSDIRATIIADIRNKVERLRPERRVRVEHVWWEGYDEAVADVLDLLLDENLNGGSV